MASFAMLAYWNQLKNSDLQKPSPELIYRSVEIKNEVVIEDPKETGIRKSLNFGHTVGHAVETYSLLNDSGKSLSHGEAIAIGMICEAWLSHKKIGLSSEALDRNYRCDQPRYTLNILSKKPPTTSFTP